MTNKRDYAPITFACNGTTVDFPFRWKILYEESVVVSLIDSTGEITTLNLGTDYNVEVDDIGENVKTKTVYDSANSIVVVRNVSLYHWRDSRKREIDFIIETEDEIFGIEVKSGTEIKIDAFKHLEWFRNNLAKEKTFTGLILYTGERTMTWSNGMFAVPINNLWE